MKLIFTIFTAFIVSVSVYSQVHIPPTCGDTYSLDWTSSPSAQNEYNWSPDGALTNTFTNVDNSGVDFTVAFTGDTSSFGSWSGSNTPAVGNGSNSSNEGLDLFTSGYSGTGVTCTITFSVPIYAFSFDINHINKWSVNGDKYTVTGINTNGDTIYPIFTNSANPSYTTNNSTGVIDATAVSVAGTDGIVGINFSDSNYITSVSFLWQNCDTCSTYVPHGSGLGDFSFCIPQTLDFDGNNDYINRASLLSNKTESSMMSWVKLDSGFDGGDIMGQKNYRLFVDSSNKLRAEVQTGTVSAINYRLDMYDTYGDGWSNKGVHITINGVPLNGGTPYTVPNFNTFNTISFSAYEGDIISITYTTDSWANEMSWDLINETDSVYVIANHSYGYNNSTEVLPDITASCSSCTGNVTTTTTPLSLSPILTENLWYHVASTYNGATGEMKLYLNGELKDTRTGIDSALSTNSNDFEIGRNSELKNNYFEGSIYETRVYGKAISENQLQQQIYQEIENNSGNVRGAIIPKDIEGLLWSDLELYYKMDVANAGYTTDFSVLSINGDLNNMKTNQERTAPLPYVTKSGGDGDWSNANNWLHGDVWDISYNHPSWGGIVKITEDMSATTSFNALAIIVDSNKELTINNDSELNISWYLKLDGKIDLEGESQLIQTTNSSLDPSSTGTLERDQQGTQDLYTYNYWSSPVGIANSTTNNNDYTIADVLKDGSDPANPISINFTSSGYNGSPGPPITIADYWIWKYTNLASNYSNWEHVRSTGILKAGEGFTMKGVNSTDGSVALEQNYVLVGKPNNGNISLPISTDNEYLVGNPYPSAIDANVFITDNTNTTGALYFWEHWGGGSHTLNTYEGGYAVYNLSGATPAMQYDFSSGGDTGTSEATKLPGRFVPVSQGFFVKGSSNGNIVFNNGQRIFQTEGSDSVFMKTDSNNPTTEDNRMKIRLGFNSLNNLHRQLLITEDKNATPSIDFGYDAEAIETQKSDIYWVIDEKKFIIQGIDAINSATIIPLGLDIDTEGDYSFKIDELINVPNNLDIYIFDTSTDTYHDIKNNRNFSINLNSGSYTDRFELRFYNGIEDTITEENTVNEEENLQFYFSNNDSNIVINNPKLTPINSVELHDILGRPIITFNKIETKNHFSLKTNKLSSGNYTLTINTATEIISKKVLIE